MWVAAVRSEPGVFSVNLYEDVEDPVAFRVESQWADRRTLERHLRSDVFGVLLGALELLAEPALLTVSTTAAGYETDPLAAIRKLREGAR